MYSILLALLLQVTSSDTLTAQSTLSDNCVTESACVTHQVSGAEKVIIQTAGYFAADLRFEGSSDGKNWIPVHAVRAGSLDSLALKPVNGAVTAGVFTAEASAFSHFRVRCEQLIYGFPQVSVKSGGRQ